MIKVLLVDDEYYIRERLKIIIDWNSLGFSIIGEAKNGAEALAAIEQLSPDLLLLDIKMSEMDGLELAERIQQRFPDIFIIILTGFDLFEYAQRALMFGVCGYLLKPIIRADLVEQLERVKDKYNARNIDKNNMWLAEKIRLEDYLNFLLFDEGNLPAELKETSETLAETLSQSSILLIRVTEKQISMDFMQNLARWMDSSFASMTYYLFKSTESTLGICFCGLDGRVADTIFAQLYARMCREISPSIQLAVSETFSGLKYLKTAYQQALFALQESAFYPQSVVSYANACDGFVREVMPLDGLREKILLDLRGGKKEGALKQIDDQFLLLQRSYRSYDNLILLINELNGIAAIYCNRWDSSISEQLNSRIFLEGYSTISEIADWFAQKFVDLYELKSRSKLSAQHQIVRQIKQVIQENYSNPDCGLDLVSQQVNRNANYLSSMFKKTCGISIIQYITSCRMEQAQSLLKTENLKLADICEQVGYNDVFYFSRKFKQYYGVSPSNFIRE
ncbi:MAG: response regulator [Oscillospiraceae bacterium]|nr:response regulator [Oscillospiraceae bacterium]